MSTDVAIVQNLLPPGLTQEEAEFVYNVEILGMPAPAAAVRSKMPKARMLAPHVVAAREDIRKHIRGKLAVSREDVLQGLLDARQRAQMLSEPMSEIAAWDRIIKMMGYDAPLKVEYQNTTTVKVLRDQAKSMSDAELVQACRGDLGDAIDVEFYEVGQK